MGEETKRIPKPMIEIGGKPILWHIMQYYASWGHNEFVLCLGYKGEVIKDYFLSYNEALFSDFILERHGSDARVEVISSDLRDWKMTFADTGLNATIAQRLKAVEQHLDGDEAFLATYGDGLTDAPVQAMIEGFRERKKLAMFLSVRPAFNAHLVTMDNEGIVLTVEDMSRSHVRINGGFFVFKREILDMIEPGDELVEETFERLIAQRELVAYPYEGFFGPMDTIKDRQRLEALYESGQPPWRRPRAEDSTDGGQG